MHNQFSLEGKTALVTGASRGIGQSIAQALARAGANVAVGSRSLEVLDSIVNEIRANGGNACSVKLDVRSVDSCGEAVAEASDRLGGLDILINNAGHEEVCPSLEVTESIWHEIIDTNLKGAFFCAQAAARIMAQNAGGSIVNMCSLSSYVGIPAAAPYTASKSGMLGMTRALAAEWAPMHIRVNGIAPGYFHTDMTDGFFQSEAWRNGMISKIPIRRFGVMDDLAGLAVFLASDASAYIVGQCIPVDGGYLAAI